jgi:predicted dehydrogenase
MVKNGSLGKIQSIETFFGYNNTDPDNIRNIKAYGGGAILDIGCYAVSSARFLLNSEPERVLSLISRDRDFKTDIISSGILDFGCTRAVFTVSTQTSPWQRVTIHGNSGILTIEIPFNAVPNIPMKLIITEGSKSRIIETEPCDQYRLEFDAFAKAVIENTEVPIPVSDAVNNMKVLDALFTSGNTGKWVKV